MKLHERKHNCKKNAFYNTYPHGSHLCDSRYYFETVSFFKNYNIQKKKHSVVKIAFYGEVQTSKKSKKRHSEKKSAVNFFMRQLTKTSPRVCKAYPLEQYVRPSIHQNLETHTPNWQWKTSKKYMVGEKGELLSLKMYTKSVDTGSILKIGFEQ